MIKSIFYTSCLLSVICLLGCGDPIINRDAKGGYLVCFGDSFTEGKEVSAKERFPYYLSQKVDYKVINAGVSGNTAADGLKRLESDVLSYNPQIVLVEFGANDFHKKFTEQEFEQNLEQIVSRIQEQGAIVVLLSVKIGSMTQGYYDVYSRIAEKYSITLVPNIMKDIFSNPKLKADWIHPNGEGYQIMADRVYEKIKPLL